MQPGFNQYRRGGDFPRNRPDSGLGLPSGLIDGDGNRQSLAAAAEARPTDGRCAQAVEPHRDAQMGVGGADFVGGIEADPAEFGHMSLGPGVTRLLGHNAVGAKEMPGHVAGRDAEPTARK